MELKSLQFQWLSNLSLILEQLYNLSLILEQLYYTAARYCRARKNQGGWGQLPPWFSDSKMGWGSSAESADHSPDILVPFNLVYACGLLQQHCTVTNVS